MVHVFVLTKQLFLIILHSPTLQKFKCFIIHILTHYSIPERCTAHFETTVPGPQAGKGPLTERPWGGRQMWRYVTVETKQSDVHAS